MKKLFLSLFFFPLMIYCQDLPTQPANGSAFPIGSKFTLKFYPVDSAHYNFSIISFEQFHEIVDIHEDESLFQEKGQDSTITFYFCFGTRGATEAERKSNMKILLIMKNYSKIAFNYSSEIQIKKKRKKFLPTSNVGTFPGAITTEIWSNMIYFIRLKDFKVMKW